jgi:hypothetical protein
VSNQLSEEDLEKALEMLAVAINEAGSEKEMLFLSKLCFVLANELADIDLLENAINKVNADL